MVLVSNEWLTNKDDDQKPNPASPPLAPGVAGVASLSNGGMTSTSTESSKTTRPTAGVGVESTVKRKKAQQTANVETKNIEPEPLFHIMERDSNNEEAIENQENNNMQVCDSNTNTLQSVSSPDHSSTVHIPSEVPQQVLHITMNSVQHANIAGVGMGVTTSDNLYSSLGLLNKNILQRESTMDCGTLMVAPVAPTVSVDLCIGSDSASAICTGDAKIVLQCEPKSHKFETRSILLQPNQDCKVGRLIAKSKASEGNAIFDCKVLSRNHAILWYTPDGRFWVKDTKSSNGTFINDNKLGNDPAELHYGDTVKFGVEVIENSRQEVHGCIIARVTLFLPDGREAISIEADEILTGPNRISFDEVQRLNAFLQEAAQREKTLKAKLSSLQGILDSTRKNSAMCWQSMISEDQLLHKISLLEKKLQMMEKNVPENALRNEVVKLLEDKTTYQLTAKEALRKVYQERCDAMQMLSKMELAYATSENECGILRAQMVTSKQTLQDFNARLEQLQQEYIEYKQESLRQQHEAKEQEEHSLELLKEKISLQYGELEKLRLQVSHLQKSVVEYDSEHKLEEQNVLKQLDAIIPDDDEYEKEIESVDEDLTGGPEDDMIGIEQQSEDSEKQKMNKKLNLSEIDLEKVIRKSSVIKLLKNSDLTKGEDGSAVLRAIFNDDDEDSESELKEGKENLDAQASDVATELRVGTSNELAHNFPRYVVPNGMAEPFVDPAASCTSAYKIESQKTLVNAGEYLYIPPELPTEQAIEMLQEECDTYKEKTERLTFEIHCMQEQIKLLQKQLEQEIEHNAIAKLQKNRIKSSEQRQTSGQEHGQDSTENAWNEDIVAMNNLQMEREEELIVYKERLENSESSNKQLRDEISHLKQQHTPPGNQLLLHRVLPLGCIAIAVLIYFISNRI